MEEKRIMTNEQLEAKLTSARTKEKIANVLIYGAGAAMVAMFYLKNIPLGIFFLVLLLAGGYLAAKSDGVAKKLLSERIIRGVLQEVLGDAVEYDP